MSYFNASLENVVDTLKKSGCTFPITRQWSQIRSQEHLDLVTRKGCFPYSFFESVKQFKDLKQLPARWAFYNDLSKTDVSDEDYAHAQNVWRTFSMQSMFDYLKT